MYRSCLNNTPCKHKHGLYREARDCGYRRERKECIYGSFVIDAATTVVSAATGAALDEASSDAAREARQAASAAECRRLREEMREADRRARPWIY